MMHVFELGKLYPPRRAGAERARREFDIALLAQRIRQVLATAA